MTQTLSTSLKALVAAFVLFGAALPAAAQDAPQPEMREDVTYYTVTYFKFNPGMKAQAMEIIEDHFVPATRASGIDLVYFETMTGEWDAIGFFELEDGVEELAWEVSPSSARFRAALMQDLGSMEKVEALYERYRPMLAEIRSEVVFRTDD